MTFLELGQSNKISLASIRRSRAGINPLIMNAKVRFGPEHALLGIKVRFLPHNKALASEPKLRICTNCIDVGSRFWILPALLVITKLISENNLLMRLAGHDAGAEPAQHRPEPAEH
jgi:hypothetical protein